MRLVCPKCTSQYEVDASLFPDEGREVQCSNCEHTWVQYPEKPEEPAPLRLDTAAPALGAAVAGDGPRPSDRLSQDERAALRAAVAEEINTRDGDRPTGPRSVDVSRPPEPEQEELDEEKILASLREQIAIEGEIDDGAAPKSQRRNLKKAAEAVGISVMEEDDEPATKKKSKLAAGSSRRADPARDKLAEALKEYEDEKRERRRTGRVGFVLALVLCGIGLGLYTMKDTVVDAYPPAEPYLNQYAALVDQGRDTVEAVYAEYGPMVMAQINGLMAGEDAATTE